MSPADRGARSRVVRWSVRLAVLAVLVLVGSRVGTGPFLAGLERLTPLAALLAIGATALATVAAAWRWRAIAHAFGLELTPASAIAACYRSQLLNTVLPGGVSGDIARGLDGSSGDRLRGLRVVAWDRGTGQAVQLVLLATALGATSGALGGAIVAVACVAGGVALPLLGRSSPRTDGGRVSRVLHGFRRDLSVLIARPRTLMPIVLGSVAVCLLHAAVFVLAAQLTGAAADPLRLLPLALVVQAAAILPTGFGGLGAREGVAAAIFAGVGLGAGHGVSAGIAAGALGLIAVLPGVIPLLTRSLGRPTATRTRAHRPAVAR